ncbi:DUF1127 domain-containing protein [Puniceibacterium sediminis]|uniref:DUF1127 domain-containing protein n=1 Tax=Puniceibacterium sediminis TaxID=1608407 RepID=A0A238X030_9RHOB|nr:DUF1127 domain-containing protein [Puniceibacterium sediminis]SNR51981.1 protein of unknown function [Puniceibacterium sediminis]
MAHVLSFNDTYPKTPLLTRIVEGFAGWIDRYAENQPRMRGVRALQAMSDEQLAARGLKREQIVPHVFRTTF